MHLLGQLLVVVKWLKKGEAWSFQGPLRNGVGRLEIRIGRWTNTP